MASKTTNYGLNKHSPQDFYNVEARNENWDKIDEALAAADPTKVTAKATPADGDGVMIADSADGGKAKRLLWSNVKAALGKLFVPLARKINGKALSDGRHADRGRHQNARQRRRRRGGYGKAPYGEWQRYAPRPHRIDPRR